MDIKDIITDKFAAIEVKNLFVCDASVFPEALGRPMVLTLIGFGEKIIRLYIEKIE